MEPAALETVAYASCHDTSSHAKCLPDKKKELGVEPSKLSGTIASLAKLSCWNYTGLQLGEVGELSCWSHAESHICEIGELSYWNRAGLDAQAGHLHTLDTHAEGWRT